jgi:hypothetical protein
VVLVLVKPDIEDTSDRCLVVLIGLDAAIVDGELLEVGQDGERELGRPGIATKLIGWLGVILDPYSWTFGFDEEFSSSANTG